MPLCARERCRSRIKILFLTYKQPTEFYVMNGVGHSLEHNNNLFSKLETSLARSLTPVVFDVLTECLFFLLSIKKLKNVAHFNLFVYWEIIIIQFVDYK